MLSNSVKLAKSCLRLSKATPEQIMVNDLYSLRSVSSRQLVNVSQRNKIEWDSGNPYNKRFQYKFKHAYYTYLRDDHEHARVKKPEDTKEGAGYLQAWSQDFMLRWVPQLRMMWNRRNRVSDNFQLYALPFTSIFFYQFYPLTAGFKLLTFLPWMLFYTRLRDRTLDPDLKETYLRDMMYNNPEIAELFNEETIHVLDYDLEYDKEIDYEKFPEFKNKVWQFFNTDTSMCTGYMKFGDLDSGATMNLKIKTMPVPGKFRYQVGEPFYFYDLRADIVHNGVYKEVVLVDEAESLKR